MHHHGRLPGHGHANLLYSAIENVVRNAARYTREGTNAEVFLERGQGMDGAEAVIRIVDSGPGVPEDALDKLFRPFYRIDDARGRQTGGAGLGLAITERAVRLHGGTREGLQSPRGWIADRDSPAACRMPACLPWFLAESPSPNVIADTRSQSDPVETGSSRSK